MNRRPSRRLPPARIPGARLRPCSGAVLLEVVLALMLFVGAAVVIGTSMSASASALERSRLELHAVNLAVSTLSEIQMGLLPAAESNPQPMPAPYTNWIREIQWLEPSGSFALLRSRPKLEIVIRHRTDPIVRRLVQSVPAAPANAGGAAVSPWNAASRNGQQGREARP